MNHRSTFRLSRLALVAVIGGLSAMLASSGCDKKTDPANAAGAPAAGGAPGTVGVLNFDRLSTKLGWTSEFQKQDEAIKSELKRDAESWANGLADVVKDERAKIARDYSLSKENVDKLSQNNLEGLNLRKETQDDYIRILQNVAGLLQQLDPYLTKLVRDWEMETQKRYLEAAQPAVRRAASSAKVQAVFLSGTQGLYHVDPTIDITDKVIDELKTPPQTVFPTSPKFNITRFRRDDLVRIDKAPAAAAPATQSSSK